MPVWNAFITRTQFKTTLYSRLTKLINTSCDNVLYVLKRYGIVQLLAEPIFFFFKNKYIAPIKNFGIRSETIKEKKENNKILTKKLKDIISSVWRLNDVLYHNTNTEQWNPIRVAYASTLRWFACNIVLQTRGRGGEAICNQVVFSSFIYSDQTFVLTKSI